MLLELRAENYTVIERTQVQFGPGLNLLTGETGAGKSILIDALVLLLGGKASSDVVRHGQERAVLACVFDSTPAAEEILEASGLDGAEGTIGLRREITATGKGRVFINNQPATVAVLRQLAPELALIHAQSETTRSFDTTQQTLLLDRFGGVDLAKVREPFQAWRAVSRRLAELEDASADRLRLTDLWRFQTAEIAEAAIDNAEEDLRLESEKRILSNAERLYTAAMTAHELLYEAEQSAESSVGAALKQVEELGRYDDRFQEAAVQLASAKALIEDVDASVRDFAESVQASPDRLSTIEDRLAALDRLKRKYGPSLPEVLAFAAATEARLGEIENRDELLVELRGQQQREAARYHTAANALSLSRQAAAERLCSRAEAGIKQLAMHARLGIQVDAHSEDQTAWTIQGWDDVAFLIGTNPGEPLKPLDDVASGGEMSRVMLALKVAVEEEARGRRRRGELERSLIFDEIDVGIGGRAAEAVGQKLKALARGQQVLCITHLPQIAAFGDRHYLIAKSEAGGRTQTTIRPLSDEDRREEIARMLSGATLTETSLRHAEHLLASSR